MVAYTARPYPSGGSAYELELYLAVANCEGLARGFYHYDADRHALVPIGVRAQELDAMLAAAEFAMDAPAAPQILITIAARFDRISWKYSSIAYSLILKDVGVLIQTLYLMATDMGLGGCAIGTSNIDLFAKMTGIEFHVEGPVGQFALGRGSKPERPASGGCCLLINHGRAASDAGSIFVDSNQSEHTPPAVKTRRPVEYSLRGQT